MAAAKVTGVGTAIKELPRSANDKTRIPTLVVIFNYRNGDDSGESERWVNEERADDLKRNCKSFVNIPEKTLVFPKKDLSNCVR